MAEQQRMSIGNVGMTDQGDWSSSHSYTDIDGNTVQGYETGDHVSHNNSIYDSLVDGNTTEPGKDATKWHLAVDGSKVAASVEAANTAAANAQEVADHSPYVGTDNYVYKYDTTKKDYVKTDIYVKGDKGDKGDTGATGGALWPTFKTVNNHLYAVDNGSNLAERIKVVNNHLYAVL